MKLRVEFDDHARRKLRELNPTTQAQVKRYLRHSIAIDEDARRFGKALTGGKATLWRYRVGAYRIVCKLDDGYLTVLTIGIGQCRLV